MRGAIFPGTLVAIWDTVSIHAPRMRGDLALGGQVLGDGFGFNPRPSHEGRPPSDMPLSISSVFQSTPLA